MTRASNISTDLSLTEMVTHEQEDLRGLRREDRPTQKIQRDSSAASAVRPI